MEFISQNLEQIIFVLSVIERRLRPSGQQMEKNYFKASKDPAIFPFDQYFTLSSKVMVSSPFHPE